MKFRQVEAFRTIVLRGSMTAAAAELGTSQPSISRLIADLEEETSLKLFDRTTGRLRPTQEGLAFYREVERSFIGLDTLSSVAREINAFGTGRLRIAAMPVLALGLIPRCIKQFSQLFPNVVISMQMANDSIVNRWIATSYCDVGFVANVIDLPTIQSTHLYAVPGVCALPATSKLTKRKAINAKDIKDETFISLSLEDGARSRIDRVFEDANIKRRLMIETPFSAIICSLIEQGLGVGIVNPIAAHEFSQSRIVSRPFMPEVLFYGHAAFPSHQMENPLLIAFLEIVTNELKTYRFKT